MRAALGYVEDWLDYQFEIHEPDPPGFVVAVRHRGEPVLIKAKGKANLERGDAMRADSLFRIASHSKTFTAVAVMQLVEAKRIRLDDPVSDHLPWLRQHKDQRFAEITVRQLMSHGAGVVRDVPGYWDLRRPFPDRDELRDDVMASTLVVDPNVMLKYSNLGYAILGELTEAVTGTPYNELVVANILEPLGLSNTGPEVTAATAKALGRRLVRGYTDSSTRWDPIPFENIDTKALSPATGFYASAADLLAFYDALAVGSKKLLSDTSKRELQRTHWRVHGRTEADYGLGLDLEYEGDRTRFGHAGGFRGQQTRTQVEPHLKTAIAALCNGQSADPFGLVMGTRSIIDYFQEHYVARRSPNLRNFSGRYIRWGDAVDLVDMGRKVVISNPAQTLPFDLATELTPVNESTLKISGRDSSYGSPGETVRLKRDASGVALQAYVGAYEYLSEKKFAAEMNRFARRGVIELG